jgi:hypothetical protein
MMEKDVCLGLWQSDLNDDDGKTVIDYREKTEVCQNKRAISENHDLGSRHTPIIGRH